MFIILYTYLPVSIGIARIDESSASTPIDHRMHVDVYLPQNIAHTRYNTILFRMILMYIQAMVYISPYTIFNNKKYFSIIPTSTIA